MPFTGTSHLPCSSGRVKITIGKGINISLLFSSTALLNSFLIVQHDLHCCYVIPTVESKLYYYYNFMIIIIFKRDPLQENLQDINKMQSVPQIDQQPTSLVYNRNSFSGFYIRIKT